jgi:hypothetical protein
MDAWSASVTDHKRNARVVVCLIGSSILGAAALLLLEPPRVQWAAAGRGDPNEHIRAVEIDLIAPGEARARPGFNCVVYEDGAHDWRASAGDVRLGIVSGGRGALAPAQVRTLLALLGGMSQSRGLDLARVQLAPRSDPRCDDEAPPAARELCALLIRKGVLH